MNDEEYFKIRDTKKNLNKLGHTDSNPIKAIRKLCLNECMCGSSKEVRLCPSVNCPLFPFRLGNNPLRKQVSEERRAELSEMAKKNFNKGE